MISCWLRCSHRSSKRVNTLAIDIGGTKSSLALFDNEQMIRRETFATERELGVPWMIGQIASIAANWRRQTSWERCGVGFGGPVHFPSQTVALSTHAPGWRNFPLARHLSALFDCPVVMDNDANAGALGEAVYGVGRGLQRPLFYVTVSTGIGGGIVLDDDRLLRGADSWAGEIGHLTIYSDGPECLCGARGCLERMCSGLWLERDHGKPARELFRETAFVSRYVRDLAQGLKAAIMLLNPAVIVVGGGIAKAGDRLFVPLNVELKKQITSWSQARMDVRPAQLIDDSVLWGALVLARQVSFIS